MKAIDLLKGLCSECINLEPCYVFKGAILMNGEYARLFPLNRDYFLDEWFEEEFTYFCKYSKKDDDYCFLQWPALRAQSNAADDEVIDFWILKD